MWAICIIYGGKERFCGVIICGNGGGGVYWRVCGEIVMMGVEFGCWRGTILLFVQSPYVIRIVVVLFGLVCCTILAHLMTFGMRLMSVIGMYPWPNHCVWKSIFVSHVW